MSAPKGKAAWLSIAAGVLVLLLFVRHPAGVVWIIAAGLILITASHLMFGTASKGPAVRRKDRRFRNPPWT